MYTITGNTGLPGTILFYDDNDMHTHRVVADSKGNYSLTVFMIPFLELRPYKPGYVFSPAQRVYSNVQVDQIGQNYAPGMEFPSIATQDGWVLESRAHSNSGGKLNAKDCTFMLGDDASNRQYRAVLSFNTARLPAKARITSATLEMMKDSQTNFDDPFSVLGRLFVDIHKGFFGSSPTLQWTDFSAPATARRVGASSTPSPDDRQWYSIPLNSIGFRAINKTGLTQLRLYFAKASNYNRRADNVSFSSANCDSAPELLVLFTLP
jgi:hypothetical protein